MSATHIETRAPFWLSGRKWRLIRPQKCRTWNSKSLHELADGDIALEAKTVADHRQFGMTWSPFGMLRAPATLVANARLSERPDLPD